MVAKKSQEESEQPAKVYQLDVINEQVNNLAVQMEKGFTKVDGSINALLLKSDSQVTVSQLTDNITALRSSIDTKITEEVEKIHLTYEPVKKYNQKLLYGLVTQGIIILGQVVYLLYVTRATG
jgi:hypothetical protein